MMKKYLIKIRFVFAVAIVIILVSAKADKISLSYNLAKGSSCKVKVVAVQTMGMDMMGQKQSVNNQIESIMAFKVLSAEAGTLTLDTWYEQLKMTIETAMGKMVMNSDTVQDVNPGSKILNQLMNNHFTIKMTPYGEITDVIGSEKVMEDAIIALKGMEESQISMMKESVKQFTSKDALKGSLEMSLRCFAGKPVGIGDSWTNQTELASVISAVVNNTWKLTDRKGGVSFLEGKSSMKSKEKTSPQVINGIPVTYNITGESQISSKVNEKTGWVIESTTNQDITGEMVADLTSQGGGVQKIPIKINSKITTTGIE